MSLFRFNAVAFEEAIHTECAGNVKGYSFVIADQNGLRAKVSGGWAQAPGDGSVPMKTYVSSCIGSVSKVLSAVALLHLFDRHQLSQASVQDQLDMTIWDRLPAKWRTAFPGRNIDKITYRQLLQHKSGFRISDEEAEQETNGTKMSYVLSRGVQTANMGQRVYNNFNIAALLFLIPAIAYPEATEEIHREHQHLGVDNYSKEITPEYGKLYGKYMHEVIFPRALESISPTCQPLESLPKDRYAKHYANISDARGGVINGDFCRSQGGWYISAQELAQFARTFAFTNQYIGPTTRASLYDPTNAASQDNRIVYSNIIDHSGFHTELGQRFWAYHGGDQQGYQAALIKLPDDYYGVGMVNSSEIGSAAIARILIDAFYDATRNKPISLAKAGLPEAKYEQYVSELGEHGSFPDWLDFYNVGSEVFVNAIWRPGPPAADWLTRYDLTSAQYQELIDRHIKSGPFRFKQVESYLKNGQMRYAIVMVKGSADMPAYHGVTIEEHERRIDELADSGYVPVNILVTSVGGRRSCTALYEKRNSGMWLAKTTLTAQEYQSLATTETTAGREITYLHTYNHNGAIFYSAIFEANINCAQVLRHDMSSDKYQQERKQWVSQGFRSKMITGAASGNAHRYAAVWQA